jgi:SAM-dependent methyltransferase
MKRFPRPLPLTSGEAGAPRASGRDAGAASSRPADAAAGHAGDIPASPWIERFAVLVDRGARVLDLACGRGRHARLFAARGCRVVAVDRDAGALAALAGTPGVDARVRDLESGGPVLAGERVDAIVVANYLHRPLFPELLAALADDGVLLYETFARGNEAYGRPANPDFLLEPNELLRWVADRLSIVAFEQGHASASGRDAVIQRLAAVGPRRAWPPRLPPT